MRKQVYKKYDYDPLKSKYELAKDNKTFLVIHGDGYADTPPEKEWVSGFDGYNIKGEMANDYVVRNFKMQRVVYFKEIELAEEWDLGEDFINELWEAKESEWHTYHDPSGTVFFKCYQATIEEEYTKDLEMPETWRNVSYGNDELPSYISGEINDYSAYHIWIDSHDAEERKANSADIYGLHDELAPRFHVVLTYGSPENVYVSDDFNAVVQWIKDNPKTPEQMQETKECI